MQIVWFISIPKLFELDKMQTASSSIWIGFFVPTSSDDNDNIGSAF